MPLEEQQQRKTAAMLRNMLRKRFFIEDVFCEGQ